MFAFTLPKLILHRSDFYTLRGNIKMKNIKDYDLQDLKEELVSIGEKGFRAEQIFKWIYQEKVKSFDEMTNLSLELREKLKQNYTICNYNILKKLESFDGTKKYLFDILDGNAIESVLMEYHYGKSICVSSQVGCKMGCKFCASTGIPFIRSLTAGEIVEQILAVEQDTGDKISNVVFMGIGEPLDNYNNVVNAIRIINNPKGINIGARHISVSTSGLVPRIYDLANENIQCTLSVSLHASNDEKRSSMMPVNNAYSIEELMKACKDYIAITNKRISFEYALAKDNNDKKIRLNTIVGMHYFIQLLLYYFKQINSKKLVDMIQMVAQDENIEMKEFNVLFNAALKLLFYDKQIIKMTDQRYAVYELTKKGYHSIEGMIARCTSRETCDMIRIEIMYCDLYEYEQ